MGMLVVKVILGAFVFIFLAVVIVCMILSAITGFATGIYDSIFPPKEK
jgi:hypothetical protein